MALSLIVNAGLAAIPIGGCLGTLFGIDAHRAANGQRPLFAPDPNENKGTDAGGGGQDSTGGGSGGNGSTTNNGITNTQYCQHSYGISPPRKGDGETFTLNPNQWGLTDGTTGGLCMNVTTYNNMTYPTEYTAPDFSVTWKFNRGPDTQPVRAFPNIMVEEVLPVELDKIQELFLNLHWSYGLGNEIAESTSESDMTSNEVRTNVAIDMFFDSDKETAQNSTAAQFEVMVWFATFGVGTDPYGTKTSTTRTLNGTEFNLYSGTRDSQTILTWAAADITEEFRGDIYPLITDLYKLDGGLYPASSDYLGYFGFGTEAFSSDKEITFGVTDLEVNIKT
ncbi:hypothetical protein N7532_008510 [Penicillium argentinense]|uniref:xyloglucan-specific endo-beta-1,4-glucanase n=1 Tax=Penicillium argentinense TaxID=1131581 RepID=A0A9W9EXR0_9EURO|nr:uncharacterized protein N7532_008510 [Penicillium argentinense]KAJ5089826.1 hypothetical protein N7532_008510 [Penicillium argentinense]